MLRNTVALTLLLALALAGCYGVYAARLDSSEPPGPVGPIPSPELPYETPEVEPNPPIQADIIRAHPGQGLPEDDIRDLIARLAFLQMPIEGACVTSAAGQLPGADRSYRNGIHQGLDFYDGYCGVPVRMETPVLAAGKGRIIRADLDFVEMTWEERDLFLKEAAASVSTPDAILDRLNGRQVWIQHDDGVITRYSHLNSIASGISPGIDVEAGEEIAYVGNSGTSDGVLQTSEGAHLHFEMIVDGRVFFDEMEGPQILKALREILE